MPKLTKKIAVEILGHIEVIDAGGSHGQHGELSNQGDDATGEEVWRADLPADWRDVLRRAALFVEKDLEGKLMACSFVLDGKTLTAAGSFGAVCLPFVLTELTDEIVDPFAIPSEIAWHMLPGIDRGVISIAESGAVRIATDGGWHVTANRGVVDPHPAIANLFTDQDGYELVPVSDAEALRTALLCGPEHVEISCGDALRLADLETQGPWSCRTTEIGIDDIVNFPTFAVDAKLLAQGLVAVGAGAVLAVKGPHDPIFLFGANEETALVMPLKVPPASEKAA